MEQFYFNIYILKQYSQKWNIIDKKKRNRLNHRKLQIRRRIKHYEYIEYIIFLETINYMKRIEKFQKKKKVISDDEQYSNIPWSTNIENTNINKTDVNRTLLFSSVQVTR